VRPTADAWRYDLRARFEVAQHIVNGVTLAQDVIMGEMETKRHRPCAGTWLTPLGVQQPRWPSHGVDTGARLVQHFGALFHANDVSADRLLQLFKLRPVPQPISKR
jgi:hypothetical protein